MAIDRNRFSRFLHERRLALRKAWKQILSDAYLSRATLHRIRHGNPHHPIAEVDSLRALAHALQFGSWGELVAAYDSGDVKAGLEQGNANSLSPPDVAVEGPGEDALLSLSKALHLTPTELVRRLALGGSGAGENDLPAGLRTKELQPAKFVPHFASGVAASRRVEKLEEEDFDSRRPVSIDDYRVFTVPVDGDCQDPVWKNGEIVLFSFDAYDREGILPGKSYYLAFTDGSTTFKRVFIDPDDPEIYILRCWNAARYPAERRVHFSEVVRIARAISKQVVPEE
jgi:hypothetical protein